MAGVRFYHPLALILLLWTGAARAEDPQHSLSVYDRPVLVVDPGTHTDLIWNASADLDGRWAVTGSVDKTVRIWSLADGKLETTIRVPAGPGNVGKVYAVAISPDGALIAAGGWLHATHADPQELIYLFNREKGTLVKRIGGVPDVVRGLAFSRDGNRLAAVVGSQGLRVYSRDSGWDEVARDEDYGKPTYGVDFAPDGRLATTSFDGKLRLYAPGLIGSVTPAAIAEAPSGDRPYWIAFSPPDGALIAVGNNVIPPAVDLIDGHNLKRLASLDMGVGNPHEAFTSIAWSSDGSALFAAGDYGDVFGWSQGGTGPRRPVTATKDTVFGLVGLAGGDLLVTDNTELIRMDADGTTRWARQAPLADFRRNSLAVSADGLRVNFDCDRLGRDHARFDLAKQTLLLAPKEDSSLIAPKQTGLNVKDWLMGNSPTLDGKRLALEPYEDSLSLAIHPTAQSLVLGTGWNLRAYDSHGAPLWSRLVPGETWAVNITGDGRLVVAAYGDGTIRWHRMTDGAELLAFMPLADRSNWVAWTPEGFYAATAGAQGVLRWHVNRGWDPADSVPVENIPGSYRPDLLPLVLQELETARAFGLAGLAEHNREVMLRTNSHISPGAQLHLLTIGIDEYKEEYAKNLRLQFADKDANDLASAIVNTQSALYRVNETKLLDKDANKKGILQALENMRSAMASDSGTDLAVIHFSGHGALVDGKLYLLPYEVDSRSNAGIKSDGLSVEDLRAELAELGQHGRVLVLLDACHSGATTSDGSPLSMDSTALRTSLAAANVSVLTSSTGAEVSYETPELQHGAFTKALLDAFDDPEADVNKNGLISTNGLAAYIANRVPTLTGDKQHPGMEVRYDTTLFARSR
jgi:WD40 repeat protein